PTNITGTRPGVDWFANEYGSYVNSEFIEDGSYIRLKNISLGYNFNMENVSWISNLNIYIQGQNIVTITDYTGYDPDVSFNYSGSQNSVNRGVDDFGYPNYKTYTAGLKLTF
ncbi:MAG: SusC/RagA family TonB-linked outer membrane protein, partial [Cyclobacteriaceae bacterium]|nr:SusC/RagA family TonB-linked outer membrane protein [Cyclobacteriaceae bacterium]